MTVLRPYDGIYAFNKRILGGLAVASLCLMATSTVMAQSTVLDKATSIDVMPKDSIPASLQLAPTIELDLGRYNETPYLSLSSTLNDAFVPLPAQIFDGTNLSTDFSATNCLAGQTLCGPRFDNVGVNLSTKFNADKPGGIDLQLIPRASLSFGDEHSSALVGAVVKIGEDLRDIDPDDSNKWYLFAGADAEALTYSTQGASRLTAGQFNLQDRIIVGDAQAGFGYKIGDADISLAYIRRDVNSYGLEPGDAAISYTEDAAALSLTWRR
ncbi:MAG: hypothetical protein ABJ275_11185 [Maricaulaceae bacterium]